MVKILKDILSDFGRALSLTKSEKALEIKGDAAVERAHSYSSDEPIQTVEQDRFGRWPFASRIGSTIAQRTDPGSVVIGVYGPWGDGKSSVLELLLKELQTHQNVVAVKFNPWYFESEEQLLRSFFNTLAESVGKKLPTLGEEIGVALKKYGSLLSIASISLTGGLELGAGSAVQKLGDALSSKEIEDLRKRIEEILEKSGVRVVVMIDDIDRLDKNEIYAIFKLVKLSAGFKHTSYILALDDEMVSGALRDRYGDGGTDSGRKFLEKIVQVPLHLPAADEIELRKLALESIDAALKAAEIELTEDQSREFVRYFVDGLEEKLSTPRQAKLYGNALTFALPLLKNEVNPIDQMLIEGLRIFYPKLYFLIRDNAKFFLGHYSERRHNDPEAVKIRGQIEQIIKDSSTTNVYGLQNRLLERLFPKFGNINYSNEFYKEWARDKRICSEDYFDRYFRYSIPADDVSDLVVEKLVKDVTEMSNEDVDAKLAEFSKSNGMAKLIKKLRDIETTLDENSSIKIATAVARNGDLLPREKQMFLSDWTFEQGAILVTNLLERVADIKAREQRLMEILKVATPIPFAQRCLVWAKPEADKKERHPGIVSEEVVPKMGQILVDRIKELVNDKPIYQVFGADTPSMLWVWSHYGSKLEIEKHLQSSFDSNEQGVIDYLDTFVGTSWGIESGLSTRSEFDRANYDAATGYISSDLIMKKLTDIYATKLDKPEFYQSASTPFHERLAIQFAFIHNKVKEEESSKLPAKSEDEV